MRAIMNLVVAGAGIAMLGSTAPAAAQLAYGYPYGGYGQPSPYGYRNGYGQPYPYSYGNAYGQPDAGAYGATTQVAVNRCADAVQARLDRSGYGYGYGDGYGRVQGNGGRVLGISSVDPGGYGSAVTVRGVASSGRYAPDGYGSPAPVDLTWQCTADYRGLIVGLSIQPAQRSYGNQGYQRPPYGNDDYSEYGYRRY